MKKILFVLGSLICSNLIGQENNDLTGKVDNRYLPDVNALYKGFDALEQTKGYQEFANRLFRENRDLQFSEIYAHAAWMYGKANLPDSSVQMLHLAIDRGMANPNILTKFDLSKNIEALDGGKELRMRLDSIQKKLKEVENFEMETTAMQRFWDYFELAKKDMANAKLYFKEFILEGPAELRDYYAVRYNNTDLMTNQMIKTSPKYYTYLKQKFNSDSIKSLKAETSRWMKRFKEIYPPAMFPNVYIVPGILNSGGTSTEMGLFVGGDMYGKSETAPVGELSDWQKGALMNFKDLPGLAIHELMHFQQNYRDSINAGNVLHKIVEEGVCDFLVELSSGKQMENGNLDYLENPENEKMILKDLRKDMYTKDLSKWMYNGGDITDRPHDLGYTMGYLIAKSYYKNQKDKKQAVFELLNTDDMVEIVKKSDYGHVLE